MSDTLWGVHMKKVRHPAPIDEGFVGVGWPAMGDLAAIPTNRDAFKARLQETHPHAKPGAVPVQAGVLFRFLCEMAIGDTVIYPSQPDRMVNIGVIEGEYNYEPEIDPIYPHRRQVKWLKHMPRADFSQSALYEIGSAITLFQVTTHAEEFLAAMEGQDTGADDVDEESVDEVSTQVEESTEDFIVKRLKSKLSPFDFEKFIAHLLTCMGYHARVTQQSADGGIDIIAHKDELGFEPPIIKVQCKQTLDTVGRPKVQELHGAIETGEHGLFVTLGAFSNDARTFERSKPNMRLIDGNDLISLIYAHYGQFDPRYQMLLPLKRTYIPGPSLVIGD
jgi:restriction system protein